MYADILINHAFSRKKDSHIYEIPESLSIKNGSGVVVPFQKGQKTGVVLRVHNTKPDFQTRLIGELLGEGLLLADWQLKLMEWMSEYYFCSKYDAIRLMLPKNIWRIPKRHIEQKKESKIFKKTPQHELTPDQAAIVKSILQEKPRISLLHGITGSGKTEVYRHLIEAKVQSGEQALLLVPEIALTPQLLKAFKKSFGRIAVIHSRLSEGKRAELWKEIQAGEIQLVIGSRSALFSPFKKLGLIVMDEEHEWTYKQEQSPRYHARTVAEKIGELTGTQLVLGSATPSLESMWKAKEGHYTLYTLKKRIAETPLPQVTLVDMRNELQGGNFSIFSHQLEQKIKSTLDSKRQLILFLNRRGSASATVCRDCGKAAECSHCDSKLTYHANTWKQALICHHCGRISSVPSLCSNCKSPRIRHLGLGTERVESEMRKLFPNARIFRADSDTMTKKDSFKDLHDALENHEIDVLIGTQMIAKGLDLPNVSLVGVVLADMGLNHPDFRASERSFQLLTQVAGRAGRREEQGEVFVQSYNPEHPVLRFVQNHNYDGFFEQEICSRKGLPYPPFGEIVKLIFVHKDKKKAQEEAEKLQKKLQASSEEHEVVAAPSLLARINQQYHWQILVQGPNPRSLIKKIAQDELEGWRIDVDPVHTV